MDSMDSAQPDAALTNAAAAPRAWVPLALLAVIMIVASAVRLHSLTEDSMWLDELFSLASSTGRYPDMSPLRVGEVMTPWPDFAGTEGARPWWYVWVSHRDGTHPPLYLLVLRGWREVFGDGDFAARGLSVVAGLVGILLIYDVGRLLYNAWAGLFAAALMAVAFPQVYFAQEARPYTVLIAFGLGAMNALARIERDGVNWRRLVALGGCALAMALTHYFCVGALVATGIYVLVRFRGAERKRAMLALVAAAVLFLLLWGPSLWRQRSEAYTREFVREPDATSVFTRLDRVPQKFLVDDPEGWGIVPVGGYVLLAAPLVAMRWQRGLLLPYLWLVCTIGAVAALDVTRGLKLLEYTRYSLLASVGLYLCLAGFLTTRVPVIVGGIFFAVVVTHCLVALPEVYEMQKDDWRGLAADIEANSAGPEPVVFAERKDWEAWFASALAMGTSHYMKDLDRPVLVLNGPATPEVLEQLRGAGVFWYVSLYAPPEQMLGPVEVLRERRVHPAISSRVRLR